MPRIKLEYIWVDGTSFFPVLRSRIKILSSIMSNNIIERADDDAIGLYPPDLLSYVPSWAFNNSGVESSLKPVKIFKDPFNNELGFIVLCETQDFRMNPGKLNTRRGAKKVFIKCEDDNPKCKISQMYKVDTPKIESFRKEHLELCILAGLGITDMSYVRWHPKFTTFSIGLETQNPIDVADEILIARWILKKLAAKRNTKIWYLSKDVKLDKSRETRCHISFSTRLTRGLSGICMIESLLKNFGPSLPIGDYTKQIFISNDTNRGVSGEFEYRDLEPNHDPYKTVTNLMNKICLNKGDLDD